MGTAAARQWRPARLRSCSIKRAPWLARRCRCKGSCCCLCGQWREHHDGYAVSKSGACRRATEQAAAGLGRRAAGRLEARVRRNCYAPCRVAELPQERQQRRGARSAGRRPTCACGGPGDPPCCSTKLMGVELPFKEAGGVAATGWRRWADPLLGGSLGLGGGASCCNGASRPPGAAIGAFPRVHAHVATQCSADWQPGGFQASLLDGDCGRVSHPRPRQPRQPPAAPPDFRCERREPLPA